jgi:hypothetical protein
MNNLEISVCSYGAVGDIVIALGSLEAQRLLMYM